MEQGRCVGRSPGGGYPVLASVESPTETRSPSSAAAGVCAGAAGPSRASADDPAGPATMESVSDTAEDARACGAV